MAYYWWCPCTSTVVDGLLRQYDHKKRGEEQTEDIKKKLEEQDD